MAITAAQSARIIMDVANDVDPSGYDAEMTTFHKSVKRDWEAWLAQHPGSVLDIPNEMADPDGSDRTPKQKKVE